MRTNEEKLELFADLLEPVSEVAQDRQVLSELSQSHIIKAVQMAVKQHKNAVTQILALIEGEDPGTYRIDVMRMTLKLLALFTRKDVQQMVNDLFTSQDQDDGGESSGPATENTGAAGK